MWSTGETKAECAPGKWRHRRLNDFQVLGGQFGGPPFKARTAIFLLLPQKMRIIFFYLFFFSLTKIIIFSGEICEENGALLKTKGVISRMTIEGRYESDQCCLDGLLRPDQ